MNLTRTIADSESRRRRCALGSDMEDGRTSGRLAAVRRRSRPAALHERRSSDGIPDRWGPPWVGERIFNVVRYRTGSVPPSTVPRAGSSSPLPIGPCGAIMGPRRVNGSVMSRRGIALLAGSLAVALLASGCLTTRQAAHVAVSGSGSPKQTGTGQRGATIAQGDASLATVIENIGLSYSSVFAGAEKLADGQVRVHTIPGHDSAFRAALPAVTDTASGPSYFFVPANYSLDDLNALTQQIAADNDSLKAKGIELAGWGPDYASNTVSIQLQQYTPSAAAYLQSTYGAEVSVATVSTPQLPSTATGNG